MPIIKSAKKRVKLTRKATARNLRTKRKVKSAVRELQAALNSKDKSAAAKLSAAQSAIDTAAKKNLIHRNKAARKQRQLAKLAKAAGIKPTASPASSPAKKPAAKAPAKKPAAKKPAAKKSAKK